MRVYEGRFRASSSPGSCFCFFWKEVIEKASLALTVSLRSTAIHTKVPQSPLKLRAVSHVCGFRSVLRRAPRGFCARADGSGHWQRTVQVWPRFLSDHQPPWSQDLKNKHKRPRLNLLSGPHSDCIHGARHHTYGPPYGCEPWVRRRLHFTSCFLQKQQGENWKATVTYGKPRRHLSQYLPQLWNGHKKDKLRMGCSDEKPDICITQEMIVCLFIYDHINW